MALDENRKLIEPNVDQNTRPQLNPAHAPKNYRLKRTMGIYPCVMSDWGKGWYWTLEPLFNVKNRPKAARESITFHGGFAKMIQNDSWWPVFYLWIEEPRDKKPGEPGAYHCDSCFCPLNRVDAE